jgi:hypothetical protein
MIDQVLRCCTTSAKCARKITESGFSEITNHIICLIHIRSHHPFTQTLLNRLSFPRLPTLRLKARQPAAQRVGEVLPRNLSSNKVCSEVVAVLCAGKYVSKNLLLTLPLTALGWRSERLRVSKWEGLLRERRQSPPWIEFSSTPVHLGWANVPAAEDLVGLGGLGPFGEERGLCGWELAVADVFLVGEGVVFRD